MAIEQAADFISESESLYELLRALADADFTRPTQFKRWSIDAVLGHLHYWNHTAEMALLNPDAFADFKQSLLAGLADRETGGLRAIEERWLAGRRGRALLEEWSERSRDLGKQFAPADPKRRVQWVGPDMSVLSCITARLMETWAHGQAVFDLLGVERRDTDRLRSVAQLGMNTFGWAFRNRGMPEPPAAPQVTLRAPSGMTWKWNTGNAADWIHGSATEFCQVVTQTRNIADTQLEIGGETAARWMSIAQCFAGPPVDPPAPGTRCVQR